MTAQLHATGAVSPATAVYNYERGITFSESKEWKKALVKRHGNGLKKREILLE